MTYGGTLYQRERRFRRRAIAHALVHARRNRSVAARQLGVPRSSLVRMMGELGLQDYRGRRGGPRRARWRKTA